MGEIWRWTYRRGPVAGDPDDPGAGTGFPTQADAEAWLGECWADLAADGVDAVTLHHGDHIVYGPMSLHGQE